MSYAPGDDIDTLERMIRALQLDSIVVQPAAPIVVPAGHASRAQRRALAKRAGLLHAQSQTQTCPTEPMVFDGFDDPRWF